jgi:hypothetical protein
MKKIINITLLGALLALSISPSLAANNETLAKIREDSLAKAMELLKGKNASVDEVLKTAKQIEDYILAGDGSKNKESVGSQESPNDFEKKQQIQYKPVSSEESFNFNGFSLGINGQIKSTSAKAKYDEFTFDGIGQQNFIGNLQADYEYQFNQRYGLLLGGSVDLNNSELLRINSTSTSFNKKEFKVDEKNHYSLFIAPTYHFSNNTLGFLKLAYHHSEIETTNSIGYSQGAKNLHGYGLGLGIRSQLYNNIYANLEIQRVMYSTDSIISTDLGTGSTVGSFGLSYSFANDKKQNIAFDNSTGKFNGLSLGVNGLLKSSTVKTSATVDGGAFSFDSVGQQNIGVGIFADYAFRVSDRALFLLGGTYDINDTDILKISGYGEEFKIKEKNHYSLFLAPAYQISQTSLGFVKLAYHHSEFVGSTSLTPENPSIAKNYGIEANGYGVGVGIRSYIFDNFYANFEVQRVFYGKKNISPLNLDIDSTIGSLGLSYKF